MENGEGHDLDLISQLICLNRKSTMSIIGKGIFQNEKAFKSDSIFSNKKFLQILKFKKSAEGASGDQHLQIVHGIVGLLLKPGSSNGLPVKPYQIILLTVGIKQLSFWEADA